MALTRTLGKSSVRLTFLSFFFRLTLSVRFPAFTHFLNSSNPVTSSWYRVCLDCSFDNFFLLNGNEARISKAVTGPTPDTPVV